MRYKTVFAFTFVFALALAAFLPPVFGPRAQAQQGCMEIRAINQATLPTSYQIAPDDVWGGPVYASLGGEILIGGMSGNDGDESQHGARGGRFRVDLCPAPPFGPPIFPLTCHDTFTYEVANSVFGFVPGKVGLGAYKGNTAKIISGTGRFSGASGNLNVAGPYILWSDSASPFFVSGRWDGEISGNVCGVQ
jgi:hypothetical protein